MHNYKNAEFNSYNGFNIPGGCSPHPYLTGGEGGGCLNTHLKVNTDFLQTT